METFSEELQISRAFVDASLTRQFLRLKKSGISAQSWIEGNKSVATLLLNEQDVDVVLMSKGQWDKVAPNVARLTASSQLGRSLFGYAEALVTASVFENNVTAEMNKLLSLEKVTAVEVQAVRIKCDGFGADLKKAVRDSSGLKRQIVLKFLDADVSLTVNDPGVEVQLRIQAALKTMALRCGSLPRLQYEEWILDPPSAQDKIEQSVLEDALTCRKFAKEMLEDKRVCSFEDMRSTLQKNHASIMAMDNTFKLELAYLEGAAEEAIVCGMMKGSSPDPTLAKASDFYKELLRRLPFYLKGEVDDESSGSVKKVLVGAALLTHRLDAVKRKFDSDPSAVLLGHLEEFQGIRFLLTAAQQDVLAKLVKHCLRDVGRSTAEGPKDVAVAAGSKSASKAPAKSAASVMAYFG